jgi:hypothetical protein
MLLTLAMLANPAWAARRLNTLVSELLNVAPGSGDHLFELARDGWVFLRVHGGSSPEVRLSGVEGALSLRAGPLAGTREAMRRLAAGTHRVSARGDGITRLEVRGVPEIVYNKHQYDPYVIPEGPFDWAFLERHVLPHVNTICGMRGEDQSKVAVPWRDAGGRWIVETTAPGIRFNRAGQVDRQDVLKVEEALASLTRQAGFDLPWIDGQLIDEYYPSLKPLFPPTLGAVERIHADPAFRGKRVDLYVAGEPKEMADFLAAGVKLGCRLAYEAYNPEQPTEAEAEAFLRKRLPDRMREYATVVPDAARHVLLCPGMYSAPPESLDVYPHVNYRVFQDMEFHLIANDPAFEGLWGIMAYTTGYAEADTVRWLGRLYRHYCIEGRTDRLCREPYLLPHLVNPDFADGLAGWEAEPAAEGSISVRTVKNLGSLESRMSGGVGDRCVVMRRSERGPNRVSQEMRGLQAGGTYVLRLYSTNLVHRDSGYGNPVWDDVNTVWVNLQGVDVLPDRSYRHTYRSIHTPGQMFFNYHVQRFRAGHGPARVTICDWEAADRRTGNPDRESAFNFVEVEPCLE